eukprot:TRINITY_DN2789_c0_g1_i1.p1 TRINITY_DN2789_c0_g1~~TRINITY_DN2789_c0_g1_i1.p1  ORF type:complete len:464 (+),score=62.14 TRINITY_DN2789_c0_g1_i1:104-1495(+)
MAQHALSTSPSTLTEALAPYTLSESSFRRYIPFREVTKRLLGEDVSFYPVMALSPVAIRTHIGLFRTSFHFPVVDLRLSTVTPELLQIAFLASTSSFECAYCLAHGFVMGNIISGAMEDQLRRGCALPKQSVDPDADHLTPVQSAVIRLAIAVSKRNHSAPLEQLLPLCDNLSRLFRNEGSSNPGFDVEVVKGILCFVGALNTFMDVMGVQLEPGAKRFAHVRAAQLGMHFEPGIHDSTTRNGETNGDDVSVKESYVGGTVKNFFDLVRLIPSLVATMALEREIYEEIPASNQELDDWVRLQFNGTVPQFMTNIQRLGFKRCVCFGLHENVLKEGSNRSNGDKSEVRWTRKERCGMMYVYGSVVGCEEMRVLAKMLCADIDGGDFESAVNKQECQTKWSSSFVAARTVLVEHLVKAENVSTEAIEQMMKEFAAEGVVEVGSLISFLCFFHRVVMQFGDKELCQ